MLYKDIFRLDIARHMDPVIKSMDDEHLQSELEEYVITPEVRRSLQRFCDEYNDPASSCNGAWISGFYGSGKSHLLKILSHLIENKVVGGRPALDYIKPKIKDDKFLLGALEKACEQTPSESILFNVGGKSDAQRRDTGESLLAAFIKVLNEHCGYYAKEQAHVALLERDLDRSGLLDDFKAQVKEETHVPWETVVSNPLIFSHKVSLVYDRVTGQPEGTTTNVFEYYQKNYHPTPEDFATWCKEYIDKRSAEQPGFRLNFFADEMGQYIADSVPLLQMLQDIAENLNTKCGRRAWITVVSQEEMAAITGKLDERTSGQFSKIQARFQVLIKIPANDANTVVKERLLDKKPDALPALDKLYDKYKGDFKVLLDFPDGAKHYNVYADEEDFEATYPLVPYQFTMFHDALVGLSNHEAFTGEYVSTGARNMLGTTHRVLVSLKDKGDVERGDLVPFDDMFEGLRDELKSEVFSAITTAEEHFPDPLGVRVLKALLLVKYNEGFRATPKNLRVLLYGGFSQNAAELEEHITRVLRELDAQTYIRRNGDAYEYMTDDEKDVEEEIKREPLTEGQVSRQIGKLLREEVLDRTKVKYVNQGFSTSFAYDLTVDGVAIGQQRSELKVDVMTDLTPEADKQYKYAAPKHLSVALPRETSIVTETRLWMQTNAYVGRELEAGGGRRATILAEKKAANEQRRREIIASLSSQLNDALWGSNLSDISDNVTGQGSDRLDSALLEMISLSYPYLRMLTIPFDNKSVYKSAMDDKLMPGESLPEYCSEVLRQIKCISASAARCVVGGTSQNSLEAVLSVGQYGWPVEAVRQAVGLLASNDFIECLRDDEPLEGANLANVLSTGTHLEEIEVRVAAGASPEQVEALRVAYCAFTGGMEPPRSDAKGLAEEIMQCLDKKVADAREADAKVSALPFAQHYQEQVANLNKVASHRRDWFVNNAGPETPGIKAIIDDINAMSAFANGRPGEIFAEAKSFRMGQAANITPVPEALEKDRQLAEILSNPDCYKASSAPQANRLMKQMREAINNAIDTARASALKSLDEFAAQFKAEQNYIDASAQAKAECDQLFDDCRNRIEQTSQVLMLRDAVPAFKRERSSRLYSLVEPVPKPAPPQNPAEGPAAVGFTQTVENPPASPVPPKEPRVKTVQYADLSRPASYGGAAISTPEDVEEFISSLRRELLRHVQANERIIL